jgi:hypothetical protein
MSVGEDAAAEQHASAASSVPAVASSPGDDEECDSDAFSAHKRELRLGMRHRDSFAVHAKNLSGAALEEAIASVHVSKPPKPGRLVHQDSVAVLSRKKHEGQLDRLHQSGLDAGASDKRRFSRDDMSLQSTPTSPSLHEQALGGAGLHELGAAAHETRMKDVIARRAMEAGGVGGSAAAAESDDSGSDDDLEGGDSAVPVPIDSLGEQAQSGLPSGDTGSASAVTVSGSGLPPPGKKKSRLRSMAKGVGSFLGLRKSKRRRQLEQQQQQMLAASLQGASAVAAAVVPAAPPRPPAPTPGSPPGPGAPSRSASVPEASPPPPPPVSPPPPGPRIAGVRPSNPAGRVAGSPPLVASGVVGASPGGAASLAPSTSAADQSSPVRGILKSPVRSAAASPASKATSPGFAASPPGGVVLKRKISFADQHGKMLNNIHFCDDLHYSAQSDHSSAEYEASKCKIM